MKTRNEEMQQKNEEEIWRENDEMKRKWVEGGPSVGPGNPAGKSFIHPTSPETVEEPPEINTVRPVHSMYLDDIHSPTT